MNNLQILSKKCKLCTSPWDTTLGVLIAYAEGIWSAKIQTISRANVARYEVVHVRAEPH